MSELSVNQKGWIKAFDDGVKYATSRLYAKLYYVPEAWKQGDTLALYNIVMNTLQDLDISVSHEEEEDA